jgi:hypothetical protein
VQDELHNGECASLQDLYFALHIAVEMAQDS